ncbi:MAG: YbaB/EbfC family nucleoid-associated protein [Chitinispirillales bacterium]|jgi:DNA-binding YbaB/EbfC family protein|nr:YbaB/EbfC family nucleoid-associated protein [Chitinispirillales bacterium]
MKNMDKMLKQAQKMQAQVMRAQDELQKKVYEGAAGGGMVKVAMNGKNELKSITLNPEVVDPDDIEMLEDLIVAAHSNVQEQIKADSDSMFGSIQGGLKLPGM